MLLIIVVGAPLVLNLIFLFCECFGISNWWLSRKSSVELYDGRSTPWIDVHESGDDGDEEREVLLNETGDNQIEIDL